MNKPNQINKTPGINTCLFFLAICQCLLFFGVSAQAPVINSFTPLTGPVGTPVTINGSAFNTTPANNTVYFGAVKATVTSSTATSLNVTVPTGATYQPITVTTGNLTASSTQSFAVTFPSNPVGITLNSFAPKTDFVSGYDPETIANSDLDGDGKADIVTVNQSSSNISVLRNTGSSGTISFAAKVDYSIPGAPIHVAIGDLDGDGKPDLVVAKNSTNAVSVFKNTSTSGTISFAAKADFATTRNFANCTAIGDLDGDGKPELLVTNGSGIATSLLKNTSTGGTISFNAAVDLFVYYTRIFIGDFDGDGKPDLVGNAGGPLVSVYRNTSAAGAISFGPRLDFTTATGSATICTGDLDGDGKPDVAVASSASVVSILRNTSAGTTISFAAYLNFPTGINARGIAMADLDGDGKPDIAATNSGGATVSVLKNNSVSGTLAFAAKIDFETGLYPYSVAIADFDGDGKPDLSVANHNYTTSSISVFRNQTDGPNISSFSPTNAAAGTSIIITGTNFTGATAVTIGGIAVTSFTVDSDTQITAIVASVTGGSVLVTTPNGSGSLGGFYNGPVISSISPTTGPVGTTVTIAGTNFNAVAANNIVYVGAVKATVSSASFTSLDIVIPAGTRHEPITITTGARTAYSAQVFTTTFPANPTGLTTNSFAPFNGFSSDAIGELDGDGKPDMVTFNATSSSINVFRNTSTVGTISFFLTSLTSGTNVNSVALGDLDGDGKLDIALTNYSAGTVSVFKNNSTSGTLAFAAKQDIVTGFGNPAVSIGDLDGDGKPDLAVVRGGSSIISLLRNTTVGGIISFAPKVDVSINSVTRTFIGDLNGDGKPEMVVANYYAGTVSVLKNNSLPGVFSFAAQIDYATGSEPTSAAIADFNGDGKPDMAVTNRSSATVSVLKNESSGGTISFAPAVNSATGVGPYVVSVADVDGDGKPDLAVANSISYSLSILKNTGTGGAIAFAPKLDLANGQNIIHVSTADFDGDGRPDVATTGTIYRNQSTGTDIVSFTPTNAGAGTNVVVNGINFTGATVVSFGGVAAGSFVVNSDVQITATVAATAGGKVSVTAPKGTATLNGFYNGPAITSFSPASGPVGTTVTISGTNFNTTPANNAVYFGAVKANVTAATSTSLSVTVPAGATYQPITVTTGNYTGYSVKPFIVTFPSVAGGFTASSFVGKVDFAAGTTPGCVASGDMDGDGKADMIVGNTGSNIISVYKNTGSPGTVSFGTKLDMGNGYFPSNIAVGDINGDGKLDLAVIIYNSRTIYVYRNTSSGGTISFASEVQVYTGNGSEPRNVIITDLDGDGKPDMALANSSGPVGIFKNTSTLSTISFAEKQEIAAAGGSPYSIAAGDFDGDGKPDLAVSNYTFYPSVSVVAVFKNLSQSGNILFDTKKDFIIGFDNKSTAISDLDGDGKADLIITNIYTNDIAVLRNTTAGGNITFASAMSFPTGTTPYNISITDFDGDDKPDVAVANSGAATVSLLKNISTPGTISLAAKRDYATGASPYSITAVDFDGDGKPDIGVANYGSNTFSVLRNQVGAPVINSFTPVNAGVGTTITINGSFFTGTTAVRIGGIAASSFTVVNDGQITATVAAVAGGDITVTTPAGMASLGGFYNGPVITSFSPTSGPIGTTVTITGTNFSATAANNTVYFGAVKAVVPAATTTSLTVTVPVGTTFNPITVTASNLTAYAGKPFTVTFPANSSGFTSGSFASKVDFATANGPNGLAASDIDGDGKADVITANSSANSISVLRATGTSGTTSFAAKVDFTTGTAPGSISTADFDGDGKTDVVVTNYSSNTVSVFKNVSTVGSVSFSAKADYPTGTSPVKVKVADLNADGKPDIIVVNSANSGSVVTVYKNTSVGGVISFAVKVDFLNERYLRGLAIGDFDNDGKPDVAISYEGDYKFSVLRNTSTGGVISFAKTDFTTSGTSYSLDVADLDGDGKDDVVITNYTQNLISFFRNTTAGSTVSFAPKVDVVTGQYMQGLAIGDLDGDGKPDVAVANYGFGLNTLSVLKNNSTGGAISFSTKTDYATGTSPISLSIADADGDGKPDLFAANTVSNSVSVLRNLLALPEPCVGGNIAYTSNLSGTAYQWQVNTGSGFVNISDNSNYSGTTSATLQLTNLPSAWYGYVYRCVVDGVNSNVFVLEFKNYWTGAVSNAWENTGNWSCGVLPDGNTDVVVNSGGVMVSSMAVCRNLKMGTGVSVTVTAGYSLMVAK